MTAPAPRRRVRLWFGEFPIADYVGAPEHAARYEETLRHRFPRLSITNEALPLRSGDSADR